MRRTFWFSLGMIILKSYMMVWDGIPTVNNEKFDLGANLMESVKSYGALGKHDNLKKNVLAPPEQEKVDNLPRQVRIKARGVLAVVAASLA